jgi:N-acyl homoserine lactone hydrolase
VSHDADNMSHDADNMSHDAGNTGVELDVMVVGKVPTPHAYVFRPEGGNRFTRLAAVMRPGGEVLNLACLAYAVRHPTAGTILIDTGLHPDARESLRKDFGIPMSLLFRTLKPAEEPFESQLRGLGIPPGEVELTIMTHLHVDHTGGMRLLPEAEFVTSRDEWAAATGRSAVARGYVAHHLPPESRMRLVDVDLNGEPHGPFTSTIDLLGDGSVRLVSTPGHTTGHLSVLLRLQGGRQVLVIGDAVYTLRSLREEILPLLTVGDGLYLRSLREIKAFAASEPEATLVPSHDPAAWRDLVDRSGRAMNALRPRARSAPRFGSRS